MRKLFVLSFGVLSIHAFSQNDIQVFNMNNRASNNISDNTINLQKQSIQAVQIFASNVQLKRNVVKPINKINTVKPANKITPVNNVIDRPQVQRRRTVRRNSNPQIQTQQPLPQINFVNVAQQTNPFANTDLNPIDQVNDLNILVIDNLGNSFGNEQIQVQQAAPVQVEHAGDFLEGIGFNISMPKINVKTRSTSASSKSLSTHYKLTHFKSKFVKMNRKVKGKLSFKKRLRLKVDNCFKW